MASNTLSSVACRVSSNASLIILVALPICSRVLVLGVFRPKVESTILEENESKAWSMAALLMTKG
jgi:hypothetical protein